MIRSWDRFVMPRANLYVMFHLQGIVLGSNSAQVLGLYAKELFRGLVLLKILFSMGCSRSVRTSRGASEIWSPSIKNLSRQDLDLTTTRFPVIARGSNSSLQKRTRTRIPLQGRSYVRLCRNVFLKRGLWSPNSGTCVQMLVYISSSSSLVIPSSA